MADIDRALTALAEMRRIAAFLPPRDGDRPDQIIALALQAEHALTIEGDDAPDCEACDGLGYVTVAEHVEGPEVFDAVQRGDIAAYNDSQRGS